MEMRVEDSRRLTGPNVVWSRPGAVLDIKTDAPPDAVQAAIEAWTFSARRLLHDLGWVAEETRTRVFPGGFSLLISAPMDALYAATEINEAAWALAESARSGDLPSAEEGHALLSRLRSEIEKERNPALVAMKTAAEERGVCFLSDDESVSVGMGMGSITWPADAIPDLDEVDWTLVHDIPVAMVTGTNGKTTTVRLLAGMAKEAGLVAGRSSTDWLMVGDEQLDEGDWSGPGGARTVLRDKRVELAILETARGGMLRRGLALTRADVCLITNIAEDHLGEYGLADLSMLADTKFMVARVAKNLVLNAGDHHSVERGARSTEGDAGGRDSGSGSDVGMGSSLDPDSAADPESVADTDGVSDSISNSTTGPSLIWFGLEGEAAGPVLQRSLAAGDPVCEARECGIFWVEDFKREHVLNVEDIPITLKGAARHNVENALGAICVARQLGLPLEAIRAGLRNFESSPDANPGRLNRFELGGMTALVDFAHNPHGVEALMEMAGRMPRERLLVLLGQAGDREDEAIRELARIAWRVRPDRVVIKGLPGHLRGREEGEVEALLEDELLGLGAPAASIERAPDELEAVRQALVWARPGDLLLLISHAQRGDVLALMQRLEAEGWRPGEGVVG